MDDRSADANGSRPKIDCTFGEQCSPSARYGTYNIAGGMERVQGYCGRGEYLYYRCGPAIACWQRMELLHNVG